MKSELLDMDDETWKEGRHLALTILGNLNERNVSPKVCVAAIEILYRQILKEDFSCPHCGEGHGFDH